MKYAVWLFGISSVLAGIFDMVWGAFEPAHQPIQAWSDHIPGVAILARLAAAWLIAGGLALFFRPAARAGAAALAILYAVFCFFPLPRVITAPQFLGHRPAVYIGVFITVAQLVMLFIAAGCLWLTLTGRSAAASRAVLASRWLFGLCCIDFGLGHLTSVQGTGLLVPTWMPFGGAFWTVLTGIAFLLAAVAILTGILDVVAARLLALMLFVFSVVVLTPQIFARPHDFVAWGSDAYNLTAVAAAWIFSAWLLDCRKAARSVACRTAEQTA